MKPTKRTTRFLTDIEEIVPEVREHYKWLSSMAYSPVKDDDAVQVALSGHSNPTEQTATDPRNARMASAIRSADRDVAEAKKRMLSALRKLLRAFPREESEPTASPYHDVPSQRLVTSTEYEEAMAAKEKREQRGHGWGQA